VKLQHLLNYRKELIAEHDEELAAVDRLISREKAKAPVTQTDNGNAENKLRHHKKKAFPLPTVSPAVTKALQKMGNGNFTKDHVIAYLNQMKVPMETWGPRAVGLNLWRRAKAGELEVVEEGKGGSSVVYRKA